MPDYYNYKTSLTQRRWLNSRIFAKKSGGFGFTDPPLFAWRQCRIAEKRNENRPAQWVQFSVDDEILLLAEANLSGFIYIAKALPDIP